MSTVTNIWSLLEIRARIKTILRGCVSGGDSPVQVLYALFGHVTRPITWAGTQLIRMAVVPRRMQFVVGRDSSKQSDRTLNCAIDLAQAERQRMIIDIEGTVEQSREADDPEMQRQRLGSMEEQDS